MRQLQGDIAEEIEFCVGVKKRPAMQGRGRDDVRAFGGEMMRGCVGPTLAHRLWVSLGLPVWNNFREALECDASSRRFSDAVLAPRSGARTHRTPKAGAKLEVVRHVYPVDLE